MQVPAVLVGVSLRTLRRGGDEKKTVQVFKNKSPQGIISAAFAHRSSDVIKPFAPEPKTEGVAHRLTY